MPYEILKIPWTLESPYSEMSKEGAKEFFEWLKLNADYRLGQLKSFLKSSGESFTLDFSPESLLPLGQWLKKTLAIRQRTDEEMRGLLESVPDWIKKSLRNTELTAESISIAFDVAIYFSYVLLKADDRISWKMHTKASKLDADRNQLILTGTSNVRHNPISSMQIVCFKVAKGEHEPTRLRELYDVWMNSLVGINRIS